MPLIAVHKFKLPRRFLSALCSIWLALTLLHPAAAWATESLTYLETAGRYFDLKNEVERRLASGEQANSTLLGYLCIAYGKLEQYERLFDCTTRLDRRLQRGDTTMALDQSVMFISPSDVRPLPELLRARANFELGEYQKAIAHATKALEIITLGPEVGGTSLYPTVRFRISALEILGLSAVRAGDPDLARRVAQQLEDVSPPFIGGRMWGWIRNNALAQVYMAMGRHEKALEYIPDTSASMKIVVSFVNGLGPYAYRGDSTTTILELPRLVMRGKALAENGNIPEAKSVFDRILASPRTKDMGDLHWVVLFERGRIAETENTPGLATALYRQAVEIVELQRSTISTEASKIGFVGDKQGLYARLVAVLIAQGKIPEAFDYVERSKSRALVDLLATKQDFAAHGDPKAAKTMLAKLDSADPGLRTNITLKFGEDDSGRRTLQVARQELRTAAPELSTLVTVNSVPPEELRALLRPDDTLVEYYYQGAELYAFVLNRAGLQAVKLDADGLVAQVQAFRKVVENPQSAEWPASSRALYVRLWQPLEGKITTKNVIVVAHGVLHYLPFAALQHPDGRFLVDRHSMRLLPSASVLKFLKPARPRKQAPLLAFGNPDLGDPALSLQFAEAEAKAVASLYPASRVLTRTNASETAFKRNAMAYSRIHFATHGKFQADVPLDSGLYLAKDVENDGALTVGELYSMDLDADLVTLSACETGLGKIANGDDVVGLTRGFLYAGSRSIVASLWSVDDKATAELMRAFYGGLATLGKSEALRQAQLKTRRTFPHPYFWAAFQLTGRSD